MQNIVSNPNNQNSENGVPVQGNGAPVAIQAQTALVASLRPHPLAEAIYGDETPAEGEEDSLLASVRAQRVLTPLIVTPEGVIVAGRQRWRVAQALKITVVPVRVLELTDPAEIEAALIESNVARQKTVEQRVREYRELKRIEAARAATRQGTRTDLLENLPGSGDDGGEGGSARDLAATKVGWSGRTAEKGAQVLDAIEEREATGENQQLIEELRTTLNRQSVDAAHQRATDFGWLPGKAGHAKANRGGSPQRRIQGVFQRATTAAAKLAEIVNGDDVAAFTPKHMRDLREALQPVLRWLDGLEKA